MESHLLQMRGLKQKQYQMQQAMYGSHLLQMRGLKQIGIAQTIMKERRIFYRCVD